MAIVKLAAPIAGIRGTVAGVTYSANKAGPYARAWSRPSNQRSPLQTRQRSVLASAAGLWRTQSAGDRADWDTWAALPAQELTNPLGEAYYISGFLWYVKINTRLERMGRTWTDVYPPTARPAAPTINAVNVIENVDGGSYHVTYTSGQWTGFDFVLFVAVTQGPGALNAFSEFYECRLNTAPGLTAEYFTTLARTKLGYAIAGNTYHVRGYRQTDDGVRSAAGSKSGIAV